MNAHMANKGQVLPILFYVFYCVLDWLALWAAAIEERAAIHDIFEHWGKGSVPCEREKLFNSNFRIYTYIIGSS